MYFLGISGGVLAGNQDGAAALVKNGQVIAAAEEERFLRVKHASGWLPKNAIRFCLKQAEITVRDLEGVAFPGATYRNFRQILTDYFDFTFGYAPPITLIDHHTAHAASTYFAAGNSQPSLILTMDFSGDRTSTLIAVGHGTEIEEICRMMKPDSLGIFYSLMTQYLGFQKDNDEYKVMGLASYGKPKVDLSWLLRPSGDTYELETAYLISVLAPDRPAPSKQERLYTTLPLPEPARLSEQKITPYYEDVAASAQKTLEDVVLHLVDRFVAKTGLRRLCLAGGVALNCVMNQKLRESGLVDDFFAPPHASDAGLAIGCALLQSVQAGAKPQPMSHAYLGPEYTEDEIEGFLKRANVPYERVDDLAKTVARDIAKGKIIGWFQGRMEFGPRALGNRSILADCRRAEMKDIINHRVKFREPFRPFTPSVLEEAVADYFQPPGNSPYMTITFSVRPEKQEEIPAVVHVDGTVRIQSVSAKTNPKYHRLISEFAKITGMPVVLNTSLNVKGDPINCGPREALATFFSTGMDCLAMGPFYLCKEV